MPRAGRTPARDAVEAPWAAEWFVTAGAEPPLAAHVVASRSWYSHHGIYVGNGKVVHYPGLSRGLRAGPVEEISVAEFAFGRPLRVRPHVGARFDRLAVVARARSRLGEDSYRILSNNCEHFSEWCYRAGAAAGRSRRSSCVRDVRFSPRCDLSWRHSAATLQR